MLADIRVLGIDASLSCTGWAIVNGRGECLRSGVIEPRLKTATARVRACEIAYRLATKLPDLAATDAFIEEPLMYGMPSISVKLAMLNGAISMGISVQTRDVLVVTDLSVSEWRKAVGFVAPKHARKDHSKELKKAVLAFAQKRWPNVRFATPDAAEAALIALRGLMHILGTCPIVVRPHKPRKKKGAKPSQ